MAQHLLCAGHPPASPTAALTCSFGIPSAQFDARTQGHEGWVAELAQRTTWILNQVRDLTYEDAETIASALNCPDKRGCDKFSWDGRISMKETPSSDEESSSDDDEESSSSDESSGGPSEFPSSSSSDESSDDDDNAEPQDDVSKLKTDALVSNVAAEVNHPHFDTSSIIRTSSVVERRWLREEDADIKHYTSLPLAESAICGINALYSSVRAQYSQQGVRYSELLEAFVHVRQTPSLPSIDETLALEGEQQASTKTRSSV